MTLKRETIKDIIKDGIKNIEEINRLETYEREELGQPIIYIDADVTLVEMVGKNELRARESIELIYNVNYHVLLDANWEVIA